MSGHGGWPLNVFLTPEQLPFYGGTYFPPEPRARDALLAGRAERDRRRPGSEDREQLQERRRAAARAPAAASPRHARAQEPLQRGRAGLEALDARRRELRRRARRLRRRAEVPAGLAAGVPAAARGAGDDARDAAGDGQRRDPRPARRGLSPLQRRRHLDRARTSRRCSTTTPCWRAPTCTPGRLTGEEQLRGVCVDTLEWALREMRGPEGGFYSALDADSEGVEGRFYVWREQELKELLGDQDAAAASAWLGVERGGQLPRPPPPRAGAQRAPATAASAPPRSCASASARGCAAARELRVRPGLDDKRLTSWNALMVERPRRRRGGARRAPLH